ncbi:hypothetical protein [Rhodococcus rhodochrous]|uniref:hypothetical protein n=1 Tax=Rhodococcus rhodochrous TaxID=1829 RepID=UPI0012FD1C61|nr:hypothetical protein [Rhodococcus rhodochrous]
MGELVVGEVVVARVVVTALDSVVVDWAADASSDDSPEEPKAPMMTKSATTAPTTHGHFLRPGLPGSGTGSISAVCSMGVAPVAG